MPADPPAVPPVWWSPSTRHVITVGEDTVTLDEHFALPADAVRLVPTHERCDSVTYGIGDEPIGPCIRTDGDHNVHDDGRGCTWWTTKAGAAGAVPDTGQPAAPSQYELFVSEMVARLSMRPTAPLLPWPELPQDLAFLAFMLDQLRAAASSPSPDTGQPEVCATHHIAGPGGEAVATPEFGCAECSRWMSASSSSSEPAAEPPTPAASPSGDTAPGAETTQCPECRHPEHDSWSSPGWSGCPCFAEPLTTTPGVGRDIPRCGCRALLGVPSSPDAITPKIVEVAPAKPHRTLNLRRDVSDPDSPPPSLEAVCHCGAWVYVQDEAEARRWWAEHLDLAGVPSTPDGSETT